MDRIEFKRSILAQHENAPQRSANVDMALNGLFECLDKLNVYGHVLEVRPAEYMFQGQEWPKMMYHAEHSPEGRVFHGESAVPQEGGWQDKPFGHGPEEEPEASRDDSRIDEPDKNRSYPKKLYHKDMPGGLEVANAEMEDEYKSRGYVETPPERGDVNYGSRTAEMEGTAPGASPAKGNLGKNTDAAMRPASKK